MPVLCLSHTYTSKWYVYKGSYHPMTQHGKIPPEKILCWCTYNLCNNLSMVFFFDIQTKCTKKCM